MNDDRMDDRFAGSLRRVLLDEVRATPRGEPGRAQVTVLAPRRRRIQVVAAGLVAVAAVAALVFGAVTISRVTSSPQPAAPVLPLGGHCGGLLTRAQASALTGTTVRLAPQRSAIDDLEVVPTRVAGTVTCSWGPTGKSGGDVGIWVTVAPPALRSSTLKGGSTCFTSGGKKAESEATCGIDVVAGGRWVSGYLTTPAGGSTADAKASVRRLAAIVRALPAEPATPVSRTTGWWRKLDCAFLAGTRTVRTALGWHTIEADDANGGMVPAGWSAGVAAVKATRCMVTAQQADADASVEIRAFPGAAGSIADVLTAKGTKRLADVHGAAVYRRAATSTSGTTLWVVDGPNVLVLQQDGVGSRTDAGMLRAVVPLLTTLDAHRRP